MKNLVPQLYNLLLGVVHIFRNQGGGGGFQMIMFDYDERGVLANDYVIGNQKYSYFSQIFTKFWANFVSDFQNSFRIRLHKLGHINIEYLS